MEFTSDNQANLSTSQNKLPYPFQPNPETYIIVISILWLTIFKVRIIIFLLHLGTELEWSMQENSVKRRAGLEELRRKLDERGGHMTRQRTAVYDYLSAVEHHPTAEEVFLNVKRKLPKISLATVYKNLEALVACEAISKLSYGDGSARYDIRTDHHYHTRCLSCGRMWDLEAALGKTALEQVKPQPGFTVSDFRLELLGYCRDCKQ